MADTPDLALSANFPGAAQADWRALVDKTLGEAPFATLKKATVEGLPIEPLYAQAPASAAPARAAPADRAWEVTTLTTHPDPVRANREILADLNGGAAAAVATEAGSVRSEAVARAADAELSLDVALEAAAYPGHSYGRRPIGTPRDLERLHGAAASARRFLAQHYWPDTTVLIVAGEFAPEATLAHLQHAYAGWPGRSSSAAPAATAEPALPRDARATVRDLDGFELEKVGFRTAPGREVAQAAAGRVVAELLAGPLSPLHRRGERVEADADARRDAGLLTVTLEAPDAATRLELERELLPSIVIGECRRGTFHRQAAGADAQMHLDGLQPTGVTRLCLRIIARFVAGDARPGGQRCEDEERGDGS